MSTRGMWGVVVDGKLKATYNHSDSYPDGLGEDIRSWLTEADIDAIEADARSLEVIDPEVPPTEAQKQKARDAGTVDLGVSEQSEDDWYCLLRGAQGEPAQVLELGMMVDGSDFANDSLFCEWAYIIDLDEAVLEVYRGFQEAPHSDGRFATDKLPDNGHSVSEQSNIGLDGCYSCNARKGTDAWENICPSAYYPIRKIAEFELSNLPDSQEFNDTLTRIAYPEDES